MQFKNPPHDFAQTNIRIKTNRIKLLNKIRPYYSPYRNCSATCNVIQFHVSTDAKLYVPYIFHDLVPLSQK
jgi:hypothetical protein